MYYNHTIIVIIENEINCEIFYENLWQSRSFRASRVFFSAASFSQQAYKLHHIFALFVFVSWENNYFVSLIAVLRIFVLFRDFLDSRLIDGNYRGENVCKLG